MGALFNPNFMASTLSADGKLDSSTINRIQYSQLITIVGGGLIAGFIIILFILVKFSNKARKILLSITYCIPYFLIAAFYLIVRFILLKGLGGHYGSTGGQNLILNFGVDSFIRDILAFSGIIFADG